MLEQASLQRRKRDIIQLVDTQLPEYRSVAAWEFHLFAGLLFWIVICWRGHRSLAGVYKFLGVFPVVVLFDGEDATYRIIAPEEESRGD